MENQQQHVSLEFLLRREWLQAYFQPIVSLKHRTVVGVEALSRGELPGQGQIPPNVLFQQAKEQGLRAPLEYLCQKKTLEAFEALHRRHSDLLLFFNYDVALLDEEIFQPMDLANRLAKLGLSPTGVVVEIKESRVSDLKALERFVRECRQEGFLIALDDVGAGHSNLDRISDLHPDLLKVDLSIVRGVEKDFYRREVFRSLVTLARTLGALVIAEGVESQVEVDAVTELGADLLQGYFFGEAVALSRLDLSAYRARIEEAAEAFKNRQIGKVATKRERFGVFYEIANHIIMELYQTSFGRFDAKLQEMIRQYDGLESLCLLNEKGVQVSEMIYTKIPTARRHQKLFQPMPRGTDHSLRDYYYLLMDAGLRQYLSEPYISFVTGTPCVMLSVLFKKPGDETFILCMEIQLSEEDLIA